MAKILHTGDIHLDSAFVNLSDEDAKARRAGLRALFSELVDIANNEAVDALIIAGDLFDGYPIRPETADSLIRDLNRAKMPIFITPGNHDPYTSNSPYKTLTFPENVHIFSCRELTSVELEDCKLRIFGAAYTSEVYDERILDGFCVPQDDYTNILALHSNLYTDGYSPVSADEISASGADYVALAHIHKPTDILKAGSTHYAYCGCLEAKDFGEQYDSGFYIGEVTKGSVNMARKKISDISYKEITVNIEDYPDIIPALPHPVGRMHLRLTVTGESCDFNADSLFEKLSEKYSEVQITDRTISPRDLWEGIADEGLRGEFLRKMQAKLNQAESDNERKQILLAVKFGIDAIENRDV